MEEDGEVRFFMGRVDVDVKEGNGKEEEELGGESGEVTDGAVKEGNGKVLHGEGG